MSSMDAKADRGGSRTSGAVPRTQEPAILAFATQGVGGDDEARLRDLLHRLPVVWFPFERTNRKKSFFGILRIARERKYRLFVMEGTGAAGGVALILSRWLYGTPYVVSSGDAIAPFLSSRWPAYKLLFRIYETALYRNSAGFIGWTPYLVGRALTLGATRGMSAPGWAPYAPDPVRLAESRDRIRKRLGIPDNAIVVGIAGSLAWADRVGYCYGYDLVRAAILANSDSVRVLIVGDGDGLARMKELAGDRVGRTIFFTGRVPRAEVTDYLAAMDVGSLPQSVDGVGSFRYTTKVSEYFSVRLPFVTNEIPLAYDLDYGGLWRLPGKSPWDPVFIKALAEFMSNLKIESIDRMRRSIPSYTIEFDRQIQINRVTQFVKDLTGLDAV